MPLYEYRCHTCGYEFDKMVSFSDAAKSPVCPQCSGVQTSKKISMFAAHGASTTNTGAAAASCSGSGRFT